MKKLILFLGMLLTMGALVSHAQTSLSSKQDIGKRHELYFGVGLFNFYVIDKHGKLTSPIPYNSETECFSVPVHLGIDYKFRLSKRFLVGASIGFTSSEGCDYVDSSVEPSEPCGSSRVSCKYVIPTITYTWFTSGYGIFRAYSGAGLGLASGENGLVQSQFTL